MPDESPATQIAPVQDAAPAAAPATPVVADSPAPSAETPAPEAERPVYESFDWDKWDGVVDSLPEPGRPWAEKVSARYRTEAEASAAEAKRLEETLDAILAGGDDPRLGEFTKKYETAEQERARLESELLALRDQSEKFFTWAQQAETARIDREVDNYVAAHPELHENADAVSAAIDAGWPYNLLHEVIRLTPVQRKLADEALASMKGPEHAPLALKLARSETTVPQKGVAGLVSGSGSHPAHISTKTAPGGLRANDRLMAVAGGLLDHSNSRG